MSSHCPAVSRVRPSRVDTVSVRDLRNHGGDVLNAVLAGKSMLVTRQGKPVAELRPVPADGTPRAVVAQRWRGLPVVDLDALRQDLDAVIDPAL